MREAWRWFGADDPVNLAEIRSGIRALHLRLESKGINILARGLNDYLENSKNVPICVR